MMRLLVTGSRTWDDIGRVETVLDRLLAEHGYIVLYHGDCPTGADRIADRWACNHERDVMVNRFQADWNGRGRRAGMIRNAEMVAAVVSHRLERSGLMECHAFIRDNSPGASGCAKLARRATIPTTVHRYEEAS